MPWNRTLAAAVAVGAVVAGITSLDATPANAAMRLAPVEAATPSRPVRYTVRAGDSFSAIASRFGIGPAALAKANGLRLASVLQPGRVLVVPVVLPANLPEHLPTALLAQPDRLLLHPLFVAAAKEAGVPADLLMATAYIESAWKQSAVSATGAIGVGQFLPETSSWVAVVLMHEPRLDPTKARDNIRMSARLLRYLLDVTGDTRTALAAYYQGPGAVARQGITAAGRAYAGRILAARPAFV